MGILGVNFCHSADFLVLRAGKSNLITHIFLDDFQIFRHVHVEQPPVTFQLQIIMCISFLHDGRDFRYMLSYFYQGALL